MPASSRRLYMTGAVLQLRAQTTGPVPTGLHQYNRVRKALREVRLNRLIGSDLGSLVWQEEDKFTDIAQSIPGGPIRQMVRLRERGMQV